MTEFIEVIKGDDVPQRVFCDGGNPLDYLTDDGLMRDYRFDRQADLCHQTELNHALPAVLQLLIALRFFCVRQLSVYCRGCF